MARRRRGRPGRAAPVPVLAGWVARRWMAPGPMTPGRALMVWAVLLMAVAAAAAGACAADAAGVRGPGVAADGGGGGNGFPFPFADSAGRTVVLPAPPRRIVTIGPALTEMLFALGAGSLVVGVDQFSDFPPEARSLPSVGTLTHPSLDRIVALAPDLVLVDSMASGAVPRLEALGIPVAVITPPHVAGVLEALVLLGRAVGRPEEAARVVSSLEARLMAVRERVAAVPEDERARVFHEIWPDPPYTAGPGSFIHDVIQWAGGINIASDVAAPWIQLSLEAIIARDPDVIITTREAHRDELLGGRRPRWETLRAVRTGRVYVVEDDWVSRPGPRVVDGVEAMARALYPHLFPEHGEAGAGGVRAGTGSP